MKRLNGWHVVLIAAVAVCACKKSNVVNVGQGGSGNQNKELPDCPAATAPAHPGPTMVHVGRLDGTCFWMDETEVTRAQYKVFLDTGPSDTANVAPCTGNNPSFSPPTIDLSAAELPIAEVDWCDAAAYCNWANKKLCGTYEAGGQTWPSYRTTCTDGDNAEFAFDTLTQAGTCNGGGAAAPVAVKSKSGCVTPTLVYDLVGNVKEWTAECDGPEMTKQCAARGGSYASTGDKWGCTAETSVGRTSQSPEIGFRCCAEEAK